MHNFDVSDSGILAEGMSGATVKSPPEATSSHQSHHLSCEGEEDANCSTERDDKQSQ